MIEHHPRFKPLLHCSLPPFYRNPPPTAHELALLEHQRDTALLQWQDASLHYDIAHPPPPVTWSNWPRAAAWTRDKHRALAPYTERLEHARTHYRDALCLHLLTPAQRIVSIALTFPPGSPQRITHLKSALKAPD